MAVTAHCRTGINKIHEIGALIKAGARTNKYRIMHPDFHNEVDILANASSMPGREVGTTDVFYRGRKYQMAGEMNDEGTWTVTIYNTEDFLVRDFFLSLISDIQNFNYPNNPPSNMSERPWYMKDITVQQLGSETEVLTTAILSNAYMTNVGPIEYTDETGEISTTEITFAFSGIEYQGALGKY